MTYFQEKDPDLDGAFAPKVTNYYGSSSFKGQLTDLFQKYEQTVVNRFQAEYDSQGPW